MLELLQLDAYVVMCALYNVVLRSAPLLLAISIATSHVSHVDAAFVQKTSLAMLKPTMEVDGDITSNIHTTSKGHNANDASLVQQKSAVHSGFLHRAHFFSADSESARMHSLILLFLICFGALLRHAYVRHRAGFMMCSKADRFMLFLSKPERRLCTWAMPKKKSPSVSAHGEDGVVEDAELREQHGQQDEEVGDCCLFPSYVKDEEQHEEHHEQKDEPEDRERQIDTEEGQQLVRPMIGQQVRIIASGRCGELVVDDKSELPYKVSFQDGLLPAADWFAENAVIAQLNGCP